MQEFYSNYTPPSGDVEGMREMLRSLAEEARKTGSYSPNLQQLERLPPGSVLEILEGEKEKKFWTRITNHWNFRTAFTFCVVVLAVAGLVFAYVKMVDFSKEKNIGKPEDRRVASPHQKQNTGFFRWITPSEALAYKVFCPSDSGRLVVKGQTPPTARFNGYTLYIEKGTVAQCTIFFMAYAVGGGVTDPRQPNRKLKKQVSGIEIIAINKDKPQRKNNVWNVVKLMKPIRILLYKYRGEVAFYRVKTKKFKIIGFQSVNEGALVTTKRLGTFYLLDVPSP